MAEPSDSRNPTALISKQIWDLGENNLNKEDAGVWEGQGGKVDSVSKVKLFFSLDSIITGGNGNHRPVLLFLHSSVQPPKRTKFPLVGLQFFIIFQMKCMVPKGQSFVLFLLASFLLQINGYFKHNICKHKQLINTSKSGKIAIARKMHKIGCVYCAEAEKLVQGTFSADIS